MAVNHIDTQSLISSLLAREVQDKVAEKPAVKSDGGFAAKLDSAVSAESSQPQLSGERARMLAESLSLQMLQTTLSLSGDQRIEPMVNPYAGRSAASMKALIESYTTTGKEESSVATPAPVAVQPLPEPDRAITPVSSTAVSRSEKGSQWLEPIIAKASSRYGVDAALIKAVIKTESNFNPRAVSHAGARGLMQLMPGTARSLGVTDSFDPEQNVMGGTRFLRDLLNRYDGDLDAALAAYNWGPGNVDKRPERMPRETREYLVRVKQLYNSYAA